MSTSEKIQAFLKKNKKILLIIISVIIFIIVLYGYFKWKYRCCGDVCYCPVGNRPRNPNSYSSEKCKCVKKKGFYPSDCKESPKKESYNNSPGKRGSPSKRDSPKKKDSDSPKKKILPKKKDSESPKKKILPKKKDSPNNQKR